MPCLICSGCRIVSLLGCGRIFRCRTGSPEQMIAVSFPGLSTSLGTGCVGAMHRPTMARTRRCIIGLCGGAVWAFSTGSSAAWPAKPAIPTRSRSTQPTSKPTGPPAVWQKRGCSPPHWANQGRAEFQAACGHQRSWQTADPGADGRAGLRSCRREDRLSGPAQSQDPDRRQRI